MATRVNNQKISNPFGFYLARTAKSATALIFFVFIITLSLTSELFANTRKSQDQVIAANFQWAINKYLKSEGKLPSSWSDLMASESTRRDVELISKLMPEFVEKYRFVAKGEEIQLKLWSPSGVGLKIIAMGIEPRSHKPDRSTNYVSRIIITQDMEGNLSVLQYVESDLTELFARAGANLANYTGTDGKWEPETNGVVDNSVDTSPPSTPSNDMQPVLIQQGDVPPLSDSTMKISETPESGRSQVFITVLIVVLGFVILMVFKLVNHR